MKKHSQQRIPKGWDLAESLRKNRIQIISVFRIQISDYFSKYCRFESPNILEHEKMSALPAKSHRGTRQENQSLLWTYTLKSAVFKWSLKDCGKKIHILQSNFIQPFITLKWMKIKICRVLRTNKLKIENSYHRYASKVSADRTSKASIF